MKKKNIPDVVIERLSKYYRYFRTQRGQREKVSSRELAKKLSTSASQVRLDLSYFGGFGLQGYGYNIEQLYQNLGEILGVDHEQNFIIVGAGSLGRAIANFPVFQEIGFHLQAIFDKKPDLVGSEISGLAIRHVDTLAEWIQNESPAIGVITTPAEAAPDIGEIMCQYGVRGILNFAPVDLFFGDCLPVQNIHLTDRLLVLSYWIKKQGNKN